MAWSPAGWPLGLSLVVAFACLRWALRGRRRPAMGAPERWRLWPGGPNSPMAEAGRGWGVPRRLVRRRSLATGCVGATPLKWVSRRLFETLFVPEVGENSVKTLRCFLQYIFLQYLGHFTIRFVA